MKRILALSIALTAIYSSAVHAEAYSTFRGGLSKIWNGTLDVLASPFGGRREHVKSYTYEREVTPSGVSTKEEIVKEKYVPARDGESQQITTTTETYVSEYSK